MLTIRQLACTFAATGFLAAATTGPVAEELTAAEITSLHAGNCITYWGPSRGTQCFGTDGSTNYDDESYGTDSGQWGMREDEMCVNWDSDPGWDCGPVWRVDADTYYDGEYTWQIN